MVYRNVWWFGLWLIGDTTLINKIKSKQINTSTCARLKKLSWAKKTNRKNSPFLERWRKTLCVCCIKNKEVGWFGLQVYMYKCVYIYVYIYIYTYNICIHITYVYIYIMYIYISYIYIAFSTNEWMYVYVIMTYVYI
jgi:hypothetical protein